jgi:hypothetical protein
MNNSRGLPFADEGRAKSGGVRARPQADRTVIGVSAWLGTLL